MNTVIEQLKKVLEGDQVLTGEPMSRHTTFRIGGPADIFVIPKTIEDISHVCAIAKKQEIPLFVLGNGSNLLVADQGMDGIVLQIYKNFSGVSADGNELAIKAGTLLSTAAKAAQAEELTGFEFAGGIPGTFGGAVVMNAGAYGGEMVQVLKEVTVLTPEGEIKTIPAEELELGYRTSNILKNGYVVLSGTIALEKGDPEQIKAKMDEYSTARRTKQPLELPSAGSTFKRPEGYFAGKLIQDAGLRGYQVGGARVSDKHCGFVVNQDNATAADVMRLIADVQRIVKDKFNVELEPEVKRVGRF
ncbi:MAG TPA: UDP-N-acetylmuramate dehydrogenase [Candidatus Anaerostipes avistercoris]|uniref:UDP-N-acetylenolpyruvoylglucosamine reductase n=1 Tax=Candidatus Anaerostipes avistercoris TaxID=2838462 RepID=A0A9D2PKY2_9FIRM|nr:UDP-N-acetylmuramate dehydrogenase [uncultured Anaerostipes sp.]HJC50763.1 UDP-N-acetylmuramate dehydrogenase [Candidatus Anaerostipes avistercoris]